MPSDPGREPEREAAPPAPSQPQAETEPPEAAAPNTEPPESSAPAPVSRMSFRHGPARGRIRPRGPLFLERSPYRRRRIRDAARLLPIFGGFAMLVPMIWGGEDRRLSLDVLWYFAIWALLVLIAGLLARGLVPGAGRHEDEDD